jgi:large subunit ribosomal protein L19
MNEENTQNSTTPTEETKTETTTETPAEMEAEEKDKNEVEKTLPELRPGMTVRVHQKIKELNAKGEEKERIQIYEGMIIAMKHGKEQGGTITVRKISDGVGVEKIFPLYSPNVAKIVPVKQAKVGRAKLYYLRTWGKRLKEKLIEK